MGPGGPWRALQLPIIGVAVGVAASLVAVSFKAAIGLVGIALVGLDSEDFESLPAIGRVLLPLAGALVIGALLTRVAAEDRRTGIAHVLDGLRRRQGRLPIRNALVQFFAGAGALAAGLSGGREGPAIHLGATTSSLIGQALRLPADHVRLLVACGAAAAITASFQTPVAAIVFTLEVLMMRWSIGYFIPVILSVAAATAISRIVLGHEPLLVIPQMGFQSVLDLGYLAVGGFAVGAMAASFISAVRFFAELNRYSFLARATMAGAITACVAILVPQVLGVGYDTINMALAGQFVLYTLVLIAVAKVIASAACIGFGLPVGVIGPTLVVGAACGGVLFHLAFAIAPDSAASPAFYVTLGMAAMLAATLRAPLAAIAIVMELTLDPSVLVPAMLMVAIATWTTRRVFRQRSVVLAILRAAGLERASTDGSHSSPGGQYHGTRHRQALERD